MQRRACIAAAIAPVVACAVLAFAFAYDAPYWDEWAYVTPIAHAFDGRLAASDFVLRINEHLCVVPSLIVIPLARATHWDLRWEVGASLVFCIGTFLVLLRALVGIERATSRRGSLWAAPPIACALFSGSQFLLWNWGFLMTVAAAVFFTVAALAVLSIRPLTWPRLVLAGLCGWAATYSIGGGLSIWPAGAVALLLRAGPDEPRARRFLAAWFGIGAAAAALYLSATDTVPPALAQPAADPLASAFYVLAFVGGPLAAGHGGAAAIFGLVFAGAFGAGCARWRAKFSGVATTAAPLAAGLVCAAVTAGAMTALKHAHEGVQNAIDSRFLPWGTLAWCGLAIGAYAQYPSLGLAPRWLRGAVALGLAALLAGSAVGVYKADERHDAFLLGRRAVIEDPRSEDMKYLHPEPETVFELRELLIRHRLTVFRGSIPIQSHPKAYPELR